MVEGCGQPVGRSVTGAAIWAESTGVGLILEMARAAITRRTLVGIVFMAAVAGQTGVLTFKHKGWNVVQKRG